MFQLKFLFKLKIIRKLKKVSNILEQQWNKEKINKKIQ